MIVRASRRDVLRFGTATAAATLAASTLAAPAIAQGAWPSKPIKIVCGFPAGGLTDIFARAYGEAISQKTGQPVVGVLRRQAVRGLPGGGPVVPVERAVEGVHQVVRRPVPHRDAVEARGLAFRHHDHAAGTA